MFVIWSYPSLRQLARHPGVQVLAIGWGLFAMQRYAQHRPGDDIRFLVFLVCFGALFGVRLAFLAGRCVHHLALRLRRRG